MNGKRTAGGLAQDGGASGAEHNGGGVGEHGGAVERTTHTTKMRASLNRCVNVHTNVNVKFDGTLLPQL